MISSLYQSYRRWGGTTKGQNEAVPLVLKGDA